MREVAVGVGLAFVGFFVRRAGGDDGAAGALTDAFECVAGGGSVRARRARGRVSGCSAAVAGVEKDDRALRLDARADDVGYLDHGKSGGEQIVFGFDFGVGSGDVIDLGGVFV